jgi:hypothetical protein
MSLRPPPSDFVIAGAPKCGTTALYAGLRGDPRLFFPALKEPHYFSFDYPSRREVERLDDYDHLFRAAEPTQIRGEISVHYLSSGQAIPALLERRPDVKIIVLARNPIDLFVSWHNEAVKGLDEDVTSPEEAWKLQELRARGERVPRLCREADFFAVQKVLQPQQPDSKAQRPRSAGSALGSSPRRSRNHTLRYITANRKLLGSGGRH